MVLSGWTDPTKPITICHWPLSGHYFPVNNCLDTRVSGLVNVSFHIRLVRDQKDKSQLETQFQEFPGKVAAGAGLFSSIYVHLSFILNYKND